MSKPYQLFYGRNQFKFGHSKYEFRCCFFWNEVMHDGHGHLCFVNSTATRICINEVCHSIFVSYLLNLDAFNSGCVQFLKYLTVDLVRLNDFDILLNGGSNSKNLCYLVISLSLVQLVHIWCVSFLVFTLS